MYPRNIRFVIFPGVHLLDLCAPLQVFSTANELIKQKGHKEPYHLHVIASIPGLVYTSASLSLQAEPLPDVEGTTDTLIITGGIGVHSAIKDSVLVTWIKNHAPRCRRIVSICGGAFLLAECGILDGRRVTTHWSACDELALTYPNINVENNPIYIHDGPVWTSAGVTAGIDLALALIGNDLGKDLALEVARNLVVFLKRPGGQAQFSTVLCFQRKSERFADLHAWIIENLASNLSISELAFFACMSERSFVRHYRNDMGITPAKAVEKLRLEKARELLLETDLPIKRIAERCGLGSESTLRRRFTDLYGNSPYDYRRYFRF